MIDSDATALLELEEITKTYPGVVALDAVSLSVRAGEVVGLIGENGAGKSTLMKVLGGVTAPTAGRIRVNGAWTERLTVQQSLKAGIAFVHQELNLFDNLDVAANVYLGRELTRGPLGLIDRQAMAEAVRPLLRQLGAGFGPHTGVADLSLAERQLLEIAKALSLNSRVVIMDEPTSSLTLSETGVLLTVIADLKRRGISVVFISHRLSEVEACADRVVVLRDGRVAGTLDRTQISHEAMIRLMTGRDLKALYNPPRRPPGAPALSVRGLRTLANPDASVDLDVRAGEILGVAGLVGAGRTEMAQAIFGIEPAHAGRVTIGGRELGRPDPVSAIAAGLYLVPEDRQDTGLIIDMAVCENVSLASLKAMSRYGMVRRRREIRVAEDQCRRLSIKTAGVTRAAAEMSGGNQQKVVLAKWLSMRPTVFIFDEPTRGIDVGAKAEIYRLMRALADEGVGIMMISSDMEEVIGVSDRIAVMHAGAIAGLLERTEFSETNVLTLAVGRTVERA